MIFKGQQWDTKNNIWNTLHVAGLRSYLIVAGQEIQILWRWSRVTRWEALIVSCFQAFQPTIPKMLPSSVSLPTKSAWIHFICLAWATLDRKLDKWARLPDTGGRETFGICGSTSNGCAGVTATTPHEAVLIAQPWKELLPLLLKRGMRVSDQN